MKKLQFHYQMELMFSEPVHSHRYTLKCLPQTTKMQQITECQFRILPDNSVREGRDSFGNRLLYGTVEEEHAMFQVDVTGEALTGVFNEDAAKAEVDASLYKYQTSLTQPGERIRGLLARCRKRAGELRNPSLKEKMRLYMDIVYENMIYEKGATGINTSAEEALTLGKGVCQDFSHILLSLCREEAVPARYVVGMLMGEGESHAWVEVFDGARWMGFDPTNHVIVEDSHIQISTGRDYRDCAINRGVFTGGAKQKQRILVEVTERK